MNLASLPFTLRQLQYVLAVAATGSFRRAAERCFVSQPSLSAQVAEVEVALGVRLFERDRRQVLLTAAGTEVIERARRLLEEAEGVMGAARRCADPLRGSLRVGVIPTLGPYLLPLTVPALKRAFPELAVVWSEEKTDVLVQQVTSGQLDAAVLALVPNLGGLDTATLGRDPFVLATPPHHPLAEGQGPVHADDLADERVLLLTEGHCLRDQALSFCARVGLEDVAFRATSLPTLAQMVSSGAGVTLLPRIALGAERARAHLGVRHFDAPGPARILALAWRSSTPLAAALRQIAETLARSLADVVDGDATALRG